MMNFTKISKTALLTLLMTCAMLMISCQTSCKKESEVIKTVETAPNDKVLSTTDIDEEDFEIFTSAIYDYLKHGEMPTSKIPEKIRRQAESLRLVLTVAKNHEAGVKYIYNFDGAKLIPVNKLSELKVPVFDFLQLRVDYIVDESSIDLALSNDFDFIDDYFALKLKKNDFLNYFLPEELISQNLVSEKTQKLDEKDFLKYLKTLPQYIDSIAYINNINTFEAARCQIKTYYTEGENVIKLIKGFQLFTEVSFEDLEYSYKIAGDYLKRMVNSDGRFAYEYNPGKHAVSRSYNILRHCGTIYSMMEVYELTGDKELLASAKRAVDYAVAQMKEYTEDSLCIVEDDVLKLGGNGLAAIALSKYIEQTGDEKYLEKLKKIGKWFQVIQEENGKFKFHKQFYSSREIIDDLCEYYPGEALLGIMRIYELTKDESLVETAVAGAQYIVNIRDKDMTLENTYHDHWLLYALNEIHRQEQHPEFLEKSQRIVKSMLLKMNNNPLKPENIGSYYSNPRSTPTATRSEGILAAYKLFKDFGLEQDAKKAMEAVSKSILYQLRTQFRPENTLFFKKPEIALGGFQRGPMSYSIRIDYVQHNISSIINYYKILKEMK